MANLEHQRFVIMGGKRGDKTRGLISTISDLNDKFKEGKWKIEALRAHAFMALGAWIRAKPDWKFELVEVPKVQNFPNYGAYRDAIDALYIAK